MRGGTRDAAGGTLLAAGTLLASSDARGVPTGGFSQEHALPILPILIIHPTRGAFYLTV